MARNVRDVGRDANAFLKISGCEIRLFQYRAAVGSAESARQLALQASNDGIAGGAAVNLSTIYTQLGDFLLAERYGAESVGLLEHAGRLDYLAKALLNYGSTQIRQGKNPAGIVAYDKAIKVAAEAKLPNLEAVAWDDRGILLLLENDIPQAERALNNAYAIWKASDDKDDLAIALEHLAELELKKGHYVLALRQMDEAFASPSPSFKINPQFYPLHIRGQIYLGLHDESRALSEFRRAVDAADEWRKNALPGDATNIQTVAHLNDVYHDYAELAAKLALQRHDANLSRKAFEALAENRAAGLREQLTLALGRNSQLPSHYFELISKLQAAQARVTLSGASASDQREIKCGSIGTRRIRKSHWHKLAESFVNSRE